MKKVDLSLFDDSIYIEFNQLLYLLKIDKFFDDLDKNLELKTKFINYLQNFEETENVTNESFTLMNPLLKSLRCFLNEEVRDLEGTGYPNYLESGNRLNQILKDDDAVKRYEDAELFYNSYHLSRSSPKMCLILKNLQDFVKNNKVIIK